MPTDPNKRERARLAQERSRARRRADMERMQNHVQRLSDGIEEMTKIFIEFSDAMLAEQSPEQQNPERVAQIGGYMRRFLATARTAAEMVNLEDSLQDSGRPSDTETPAAAADEQSAEDPKIFGIGTNMDATKTSPLLLTEPYQDIKVGARNTNNGLGVSRFQNQGSSVNNVQFSPRMDYGLFVGFANTFPRNNMRRWIDLANDQKNAFAAQLFWNGIHHGHRILSSMDSESLVQVQKKFRFSLRIESREALAGRMRRRLPDTPKSVPIFLVDKHSFMRSSSSAEVSRVEARVVEEEDIDPFQELVSMSSNAEIIKREMAKEGMDATNDFLDAVGVQSRLSEVWGLNMTNEDAENATNRSQGFVSHSSLRLPYSGFEAQWSTSPLAPNAYSSEWMQDPYSLSSFHATTSPSSFELNQPSLNNATTQQSSFDMLQPYKRQKINPPSQNTRGGPLPKHNETLWNSLIRKIALESQCLGDRIGFPITAVDNAVHGVLIGAAA